MPSWPSLDRHGKIGTARQARAGWRGCCDHGGDDLAQGPRFPAGDDGPFAETKEQLLGFYIVDCVNLDEALSITKELAQVISGRCLRDPPCRLFFRARHIVNDNAGSARFCLRPDHRLVAALLRKFS